MNEWPEEIEPLLPFDPHDTLADPEKHARLPVDNQEERREREADSALSDFGSAALHRRWRREEE